MLNTMVLNLVMHFLLLEILCTVPDWLLEIHICSVLAILQLLFHIRKVLAILQILLPLELFRLHLMSSELFRLIRLSSEPIRFQILLRLELIRLQDPTVNSLSAAGFAANSTPPQAPGFSWMEFIKIKFMELTGLEVTKFEELSKKIEDVRRGEERKENDEGNTDLIKAGVFILSNSVSPPPLFYKKQISLERGEGMGERKKRCS